MSSSEKLTWACSPVDETTGVEMRVQEPATTLCLEDVSSIAAL